MKAKTWLFLILAIAVLLRFWQLVSIPPALDWDEVSNAYNGYSILKTGSDEFGQNFPILFRAYDGYVPPVLVYLSSVSTFFFGLSEFSARLPNAILSVMTVFLVYLLVKKLSRDEHLSLLSAMFLAISPWHIFYSRINVFPTTPIFFVVFGVYFFLLGLERARHLVISATLFILAIFSYFSAYVFVPLFVSALVLIYRKKLCWEKIVLFLIPVVLGAFLIFVVIPGGQNRAKGISVISDPDLIKRSAQLADSEGPVGRLVHNRRLDYAQKIAEGYFANFRFDFLFSKGDAVERMVVGGAGFGLLLLFYLPFLVLGFIYLISKKPNGWQIYLSWLLISPIAASFALPQPASTRATLMIVPLCTITAFGFWSVFKSRVVSFKAILILLLIFNFSLFFHQYFVHFANEKSKDWFWGYRELFQYLNSRENLQKNVHFVFRGHDNLDQIHMFLLFYDKIDPALWQANGGTRLGCLGTTGQFSFDRYKFLPISCLTEAVDPSDFKLDDLIVTNYKLSNNPKYIIRYPNGEEAFFVQDYSFLSLTKNPLTVFVAK